mmetsp:Transcript_71659/g.193755  ORF Transcript_71659/g.193755 Transcript_71659/m.193755 type:complete len:221 (-) Transcript_71659:273-935(-)
MSSIPYCMNTSPWPAENRWVCTSIASAAATSCRTAASSCPACSSRGLRGWSSASSLSAGSPVSSRCSRPATAADKRACSGTPRASKPSRRDRTSPTIEAAAAALQPPGRPRGRSSSGTKPSPSRNSMRRTPRSVSTSKTMLGGRSSMSSSRSRATHALLTSSSLASFSLCSWSSPSDAHFSFSISRSFFCSARTLRLTDSLSWRSTSLGFGPWCLGATPI